MTEKQYAFWLRKLGRLRLRSIADRIGGRAAEAVTVPEIAVRIVEQRWGSRNELHEYIRDGFIDGAYHQTIYLRRLDANPADFLARLQAAGATEPALHDTAGGAFRGLFLIPHELTWVSADNTVVKEDLHVPLLIELRGGVLIFRVMTISKSQWRDVLPDPVRVLGSVRPAFLLEYFLSVLATAGYGIGTMVNYSGQATALMRSEDVDTFDGSYHKIEEGRLKGVSMHASAGARGRVSLREAMPEEFTALANATVIQKSTVATKAAFHGMPPGSRLILRPFAGEVVLAKRMLEGGTGPLLAHLVVG